VFLQYRLVCGPAVLAHRGARSALEHRRLRRFVGLLDGLNRVGPIPLSGHRLCHPVRLRRWHRYRRPGGVWRRAGSPGYGACDSEHPGMARRVRDAWGWRSLGATWLTVARQTTGKHPDGWGASLIWSGGTSPTPASRRRRFRSCCIAAPDAQRWTG
jgi:hypothetical protein